MKIPSICSKEEKLTSYNPPHINPIYASSSFQFETLEEGINIFNGSSKGYVYSRFSNPNVELLENKIARLEGYQLDSDISAVVTNSGMSALSTLLASLTQPGDTIITQPALYGGSMSLIDQYFATKGIDVLYLDLLDIPGVEQAIKEVSQKAVLLIETPANPTLTCYDLEGLAKVCKHYNVRSIVDNTFATFILQQPLKHGIDYVIHSNTKYINGHGNGISGVIVGPTEMIKSDNVEMSMKLNGSNCSPFEAWLCYQGMKTMSLRVNQQSSNAASIASYLDHHTEIEKVFYPGLISHSTHSNAKKTMNGGFGAMISFDLGSLDRGKQLMKKLDFITMAPTLGDVDTIVLHPASMSHLNMKVENRMELGITDGLIRMSVGIEYLDDIIQDLDQALEQL
ncbi:trans-sulfuration enzyme family protein [Membranihabitans marinus]|uniref:trans-sulfuration enzyme family protein n=1 Tax=Membranihabitans marinus TaxID=1227546 RepID=UPI001F180381|nr:PLP-dependent aspartate aminotransferase family protein [Membranihabitans marinus]